MFIINDIAVYAKQVTQVFNVNADEIVKAGRLAEPARTARKAAVYLCQQRWDYKLKNIASAFGLKRYGSASAIIGNFKRDLQSDKI